MPVSHPTTPGLSPADLAQLRAASPGVRVIDVRTPGEFAARHIPGSYNVPLPELDEHRAELTSSAAAAVVLVCESGRRAGVAEAQLAAAGLGSIHVLDGGIAAWEAAGGELNRHTGPGLPWTLERQVRLVAGAAVAISVAAGIAWPPARLVAGAVGLGLVTAAVTDTCALGAALARLPYNRRQAGTCDLPAVVSHLTSPSGERPDERPEDRS